MLLDDVFKTVKRINKAWVRKDGELRLVKKDVLDKDMSEQDKPLFPISKPRYPEKTGK